MGNEPRLEEKAISQVVEMGVSSQLDQAEHLSVEVRTDLGQVVQGQVDSVTVQGQGVVVQKELRVQEIELHTDRIAVNPLSILLGQINLDQPIDSRIRLVLTEDDINHALSSSVVSQEVSKFKFEDLSGNPVALEVQHPLRLYLPEEGKLEIQGWFLLCNDQTEQLIGFNAITCPKLAQKSLILEEFRCQPGQGMSLNVTLPLMSKLNEFFQNPYIRWQGMEFQLLELEIRRKRLIIQAESRIHQLTS